MYNIFKTVICLFLFSVLLGLFISPVLKTSSTIGFVLVVFSLLTLLPITDFYKALNAEPESPRIKRYYKNLGLFVMLMSSLLSIGLAFIVSSVIQS